MTQHLTDLAFDSLDAALFGVLAKKACIERGVEMIGVTQIGGGCAGNASIWKSELVFSRNDFSQAIVADVMRMSVRLAAQPPLMEVHAVDIDAVETERMKVPRSFARPVHELDAELERRLGCT